MPKWILSVLLIASLIGGTFFVLCFRVEREYENGKPVGYHIVARTEGFGMGLTKPWRTVERPQARPLQSTFRIASFHVDRLDDRKLSNRRISEVLTRFIAQFEIVAIQGFEGANRGEVLRLVEMLNQGEGGRKFDFAANPIAPGGRCPEYMAFLFDPTAVDIDPKTVRSIEDPTGTIRVPPLTAQFRVRGPKPADAFTFQLISVRSDPEQIVKEVDLLADVYRAVRDDGRNEDDIIMLGDFGADENHLGRLGLLPDMVAVIHASPTMLRISRRTDNIVFNRRATVEYNGRGEAFDLVRMFDLTLDNALQVSEHLPVWAEFSSFEGGHPGLMSAETTENIP